MASFNIDHLLTEISPDAPCGENLEYNADFIELEQIARGKAEQQFGDTVIPAQEPDWAEIRRLALDLSERTHDLRVVDYLARASVRTHGFAGLNDTLTLLRGWIEHQWEQLHPQLDPDDDNDPTARINVIGALCDPQTMLRGLRLAPLVQSRVLGRFGLRDIAIASGETPPPAGMDTPPNMPAIEAAFKDQPLEELQATADAVRSAIEQVTEIERLVTERVGADKAMSLDPLKAVLKDANKVLTVQLAARGGGAAGNGAAEPMAGGAAHAVNGAAAAGFAVGGQVRGRDDVTRLLDMICDYYVRQEPSSPVPVLLQRARKLVSMSFMEIVQDLIPDAVAAAEVYRGRQAE